MLKSVGTVMVTVHESAQGVLCGIVDSNDTPF